MTGIYSGRVTATHEWTDVPIPESADGNRVVVASLDTYDGTDTADVRARHVGPDGVELAVEEERSSDDETRHVSEEIGFLATGTGAITDRHGNRIGESGVVSTDQADRDQWHTVDLDGSYANPVAFAQLMSHEGADPCHARLRNVGSDGFEFQIEEWNYLNGPHVEEAVGYVVVESGIHRLNDGFPIEVGTTLVSDAWRRLAVTAAVGSNPALLTRTQTVNGSHEVVTRNRNVTSDGAEVRLQEEEARGGAHVDETVGYAALPKVLSDGTVKRVVANQEWTDSAFTGSRPPEPVVLASVDTFNGSDTVDVRTRNVRGGTELSLEEETSGDDETRHNDEVVSGYETEVGPVFDSDGVRVGEVGSLSTDQPAADEWHAVDLNDSYSAPVAFAQVMTYNGSDPCHVRLRNVGSDGFEFKIEEWDYLDGAHDRERIGYVVLEAGTHDLAGGGPVEVGTTSGDDSWTGVGFGADLGAEPALLARCQSFDGSDEVVTRSRNVSADGADLRLQEEEGSDGSHTSETIGYAALTRRTADVTAGTVRATDEWRRAGLSGVPSTDPVVLSSVESFDGGNTVGVRLRNVGGNGTELLLEEETSADDETSHVPEDVGLFATATGPIRDTDGARVGEAGTVDWRQPGRDRWKSVALDGSYSDPVAFAQVMTYNGSDPCHVRLRNVGSDSFEFRLEEWNYLNGPHVAERFGYVVFERGVHEIGGEVPIEAGTVETDHEFTRAGFGGDLGFNPAFVSRCQTFRGSDEVVTRNRDVDADGADVRLQEEEGNDGRHVAERVGYLATPRMVLGRRRPLTEFHPSQHGFAFTNDFEQLPDLPNLPGNIDNRIGNISVDYGLCGGMVLAARDFFVHDRDIPSDNTPPDSGPLFDYLWERQIDTFDRSNGYRYLAKFVDFYLPTTYTRTKSVSEFRSVKRALDSGKYPVVGLVYVRAGSGNIWNNHQVLALDYVETGGETRIRVYDPNRPGDNEVELRVELKSQGDIFAPGDEKIDAAEYSDGSKLHRDDVGALDVIGIIHMDVPSQDPPRGL